MKPSAIVFGCSGQDGSYLSKSLLDKGFEVIGTSRKNKPNLERLATLGIKEKIKVISCDLESFDQTRKIIKEINPKEIYNLSAQSSVGKSFENPVGTHKSIVDATLNILESCREIAFTGNIFFAGSSEIFGHTKTPADINSKIDLRSPYATAKYQSFLLSKLYRNIYNINCVTGILFNHESVLRDNNFIIKKVIIEAVKIKNKTEKKLIVGDISVIRDWGYAEEYIEAMQLINRSQMKKDYIICTGKSYRLQEIIEMIFEKLELKWKDHVKISKDLFRKSEIVSSEGNPQAVNDDLGWKATTDVKQMIDILINHELKNIEETQNHLGLPTIKENLD